MATYIALLRGINVSGQKKIRMADLKVHMLELGFENVQTYIQSGNLIFTDKKQDTTALARSIEQKLLEKYGFEVPVLVKSLSDLSYILNHNPYLENVSVGENKLYLCFLFEHPIPNSIEKFKGMDSTEEKFSFDGDYIFLCFENGYGRARLNNNFFENKLSSKATTRNWKTIIKLYEMAKETLKYDIVILTEARYINPGKMDMYVRNVLSEEQMLTEALEKRGLSVGRVSWDNPKFDWSSTRFILFRSTWDYFERFPEFSSWLERVNGMTSMVNPYKTIKWNIDKHYLGDLEQKGINIPPTLFLEPGDPRSLSEIIQTMGWSEIILKPAVSGGAWNTYFITPENLMKHEDLYKRLIATESMLVQEFQRNVVKKGELALMVFGGKFSHAILKKVKDGDFRVQDDWGGTVHDHKASEEEIDFAEKVVSVCDPLPLYARVDLIRDNKEQLCVSELELIEPELWFRKYSPAVELLADLLMDKNI